MVSKSFVSKSIYAPLFISSKVVISKFGTFLLVVNSVDLLTSGKMLSLTRFLKGYYGSSTSSGVFRPLNIGTFNSLPLRVKFNSLLVLNLPGFGLILVFYIVFYFYGLTGALILPVL